MPRYPCYCMVVGTGTRAVGLDSLGPGVSGTSAGTGCHFSFVGAEGTGEAGGAAGEAPPCPGEEPGAKGCVVLHLAGCPPWGPVPLRQLCLPGCQSPVLQLLHADVGLRDGGPAPAWPWCCQLSARSLWHCRAASGHAALGSVCSSCPLLLSGAECAQK